MIIQSKPLAGAHGESVWLLVMSLVCCVCSNDAALAVTPDAMIEEHTRRLGAPSFVAREEAAQQLLEIGRAAVPALKQASRSHDREIRARARRVLALLNKRRRAEDLAAFKQYGTLPAESGYDELPGWNVFSAKHGEDVASRAMFARIFDSEWQMLTEYFSTQDPLRRQALTTERHERIKQLFGNRGVGLGTSLAFFFLGSENPDQLRIHADLHTWIHHPELRGLLLQTMRADADERRIARKIVGSWLVAASGAHISDAAALQTAVSFGLYDESSDITRRVLTDVEAMPQSKSSAMQAIVRRNDKSQIELIEPYLTDKTLLGTVGKRERQLRDVALASLMQLHGHDVGKIGIRPIVERPVPDAFAFRSLGFESEEDREKAFEIYEQLQAAKQKAPSATEK